jgi:large subunit ribosomal protein L28
VSSFVGDLDMPRVCAISGKKTMRGRQYTRRGLAKSKGGVGRKITGNNLRTFKPNLQRVRAVVNGKSVRIRVSAKLVSRGGVVKPMRRTWTKEAQAAIDAGTPAVK